MMKFQDSFTKKMSQIQTVIQFIIYSDGFPHILKSLWMKCVLLPEVNSSCTFFLLAIPKSLIGPLWQKKKSPPCKVLTLEEIF